MNEIEKLKQWREYFETQKLDAIKRGRATFEVAINVANNLIDTLDAIVDCASQENGGE